MAYYYYYRDGGQGEDFKETCIKQLESLTYHLQKNFEDMDFENAVQKEHMREELHEMLIKIEIKKQQINGYQFNYYDV